MNKNNNKGFTLIELIVVIVILGILAVTAAPKFIDLQADARKSALQGLKGAMSSAAKMVYGKAVLQGVEKTGIYGSGTESGKYGGTKSVCLDSTKTCTQSVKTSWGYPTASEDGILKVLDINAVKYGSDSSNAEWVYKYKAWGDDSDKEGNQLSQIIITFKDMTPPDAYQDEAIADGCYVFYDMPGETKQPKIIIVDSGC